MPTNYGNNFDKKLDEVKIDLDVVEEEPVVEDEMDLEPVQVQPEKVIFVPLKDFDARINQDDYDFCKGVPAEVTRDLANFLMEDETRGYIRD